MFKYSPLGHSTSGSPLTRLQLRHLAIALGATTLFVLLLTGTSHRDQVSALAHSVSKGRLGSPLSSQGSAHGYQPGGLGKSLLRKHKKYLSYEDWQSYLNGNTEMMDDMFNLNVPMVTHEEDQEKTEEACADWNAGSPRDDKLWDECWRAKMWSQIEDFEMPESFRMWASTESRNSAALGRLQKCLEQPFDELSDYPKYNSTCPFEPISLESVDDRIEKDTRPCSKTSTRVVLGNWWYFSLAYGDPKANPGEAVWLRNQINVLYELGYTVIATDSYQGMIEGHAAMPDVISIIWTEDKHTLTCQDDARCALFSEFKPTNEKYPGTDIRADHTSTFWDDIPEDADRRPAQRWAWAGHELSALPKKQRGTIPISKLFTTTYWGARPNDPFWDFTDKDFTWNPLGQQWTLTPFDYPEHSYIPYSIERECMKTRYVDPESREDRLFILAKSTEYFNEPFTGIPRSFWAGLGEQTNLTAISTAMDDPNLVKEGSHIFGVPEGIESIGDVSKGEFEIQLARAKLMLGIGRPYISPSVYSSLCQGTPVVIPYFQGVAVPHGWKLFDGQYSQHGPAAAIGAPYVYSYDYKNMTDLVDKVNAAASHPIERYIPKDMKHTAVERNMDDLMRFNWKRHAIQLQVAQPVKYNNLRRWVIGRCFKIGRCEPLHGDLVSVN